MSTVHTRATDQLLNKIEGYELLQLESFELADKRVPWFPRGQCLEPRPPFVSFWALFVVPDAIMYEHGVGYAVTQRRKPFVLDNSRGRRLTTKFCAQLRKAHRSRPESLVNRVHDLAAGWTAGTVSEDQIHGSTSNLVALSDELTAGIANLGRADEIVGGPFGCLSYQKGTMETCLCDESVSYAPYLG